MRNEEITDCTMNSLNSILYQHIKLTNIHSKSVLVS